MELTLDGKDVALLHRVVENYLDGVRTAFGSGEEGARAMLEDEQVILDRILRDLHALSGGVKEPVSAA